MMGPVGLTGPHFLEFSFNAFSTTINDEGPPVVVPITCTPQDVGLRTAVFTLQTNDPQRPNVAFNLICEGVAPQLLYWAI
ncbi:MAG: hypothetical protein IAE79_21695 [Anaerolinea sp.]|nr:hypothetical protein [Anaerolinea sp.]